MQRIREEEGEEGALAGFRKMTEFLVVEGCVMFGIALVGLVRVLICWVLLRDVMVCGGVLFMVYDGVLL